jgi:RecA-family ATPase
LTPPKPKISIIDFSRDIGKQEFWMDGLIGPGMLTIWAAQPKSGKSFAVMQIGHSLSQGGDIWGFKVPKSVRVLYFQGELSQEMVADRAISMFGRRALADPRQFALTEKPKETISLVQHPEYLNDIAEHYDVVIVDPLSAFNSNDENSFTSVRETISVFDALKAKGKAVVIVHHTRKLATDREGNVVPPTSNDIRGSSAWFGAADAIAMQYTTSDGHSKVKFTFRAAPERPTLKLYRQLNGGFTDNHETYLAETTTLKIPQNFLN